MEPVVGDVVGAAAGGVTIDLDDVVGDEVLDSVKAGVVIFH